MPISCTPLRILATAGALPSRRVSSAELDRALNLPAGYETYPEGVALCEIRAWGTRRTPAKGAEPADYLFRMLDY